MRRITNIFLCALVLFMHAAIAQHKSVEWGVEVVIPRTEALDRLAISADSQILLISTFDGSLALRSLSGSTDDEPYFIQKPSSATLIDFKQVGSSLTLLFELPMADSNEVCLMQYVLYNDSAKLILNQCFNLSIKQKPKQKHEAFLAVSPDGKKVMVIRQEAFSNAGKGSMNLFVRNDSTQKISHLPSEFDADDIELLGAAIDNAGIVYFATKTGVKLNSPFRKKHMLYTFNPESMQLTEFDLSAAGYYIQDATISVVEDGAYMAMLYHRDPLATAESQGYILVKFGHDGKDVLSRVARDFDAQTISLHQGVYSQQKGAIEDIFLIKTLELAGQPVLAFEKRYYDQVCNADPRTGIMTCTDQYHFKGVTYDFLGINSKPVTIDKHQLDYDRPGLYSGHSGIIAGVHLYMLYNDHLKNTVDETGKTMNNISRSALRVVQMNADGVVFQTTLSDSKQSDYAFVPKAGLLLHQGELIYLTANGKKVRMVRMDISKLNSE